MAGFLDLCSDLAKVRFGPGDVLIDEGEPSPGFFVLESGTVAVRKGDSEIVRVSRPEAVFGETSALLGTPATASVIARTEVFVRYIADGEGYLASNHAVALHTARVLAARLVLATNSLSDLKARFTDRADHFGLVDRVLDTLLQQDRLKAIGDVPGGERSGR